VVEEEFLGTGQYTRKAPALSTLTALAGAGTALAGAGTALAGAGTALAGAGTALVVSERRYAARYLLNLRRGRP